MRLVSRRLLRDRKHDAESGFAAHHAVIGFGDAFQRKDFIHRTHTVSTLKASVSWESIDVPEYQPLTDRCRHEQEMAKGQRWRRAENHQRAVEAQAALHARHGVAAGDRGENDLGAAEFLQFRRRVLRLAVNVMLRAQLSGERFLVFAARNADGFEAHLGGVLHARDGRVRPGRARPRHRPAARRCCAAR